MAIPLKYNTASQEIPLGFFLDSGDGDAEETTLTISNTDIWLWKSGATTLANKNSGGATHIQNGLYYCTLDATDTNTYGPLLIFIHESGALALKQECWVMNQNAYDALFAADGTGYVEADAVQISTGAITAAAIATDAITSAEIAASGANKIADHTIRRTFQNACDSADGDTKAFRSLLGAIGKLVNKIAPDGSNLEIFEDDDITVLGTQAMTTDSGADPVTALDTT